MSGEGEYTYANGDQYTGNWINNKKEGRGVMIYKQNGEKYEGQWKNSKKHGNGKYIFESGDVYEGYWFEN